MSEPQDGGNAPATNPVAVAGATASNTTIVNVIVPRQAVVQHGPAHGLIQKPGLPSVPPSSSHHGMNYVGSTPQHSPYQVDMHEDTVYGKDVTTYTERKVGADGTTTVTGSLTVRRDPNTNSATVVLQDKHGEVITHSDVAGASGYLNQQHPMAYGTLRRDFSFTPGIDDAWVSWRAPSLDCGKTVHEPSISNRAHNREVDTYSEATVSNFFDQHPGLAEKARKEAIPLTFAGGRTVDLAQIESGLPAKQTYGICEAGQGNVGTVVKRQRTQ